MTRTGGRKKANKLKRQTYGAITSCQSPVTKSKVPAKLVQVVPLSKCGLVEVHARQFRMRLTQRSGHPTHLVLHAKPRVPPNTRPGTGAPNEARERRPRRCRGPAPHPQQAAQARAKRRPTRWTLQPAAATQRRQSGARSGGAERPNAQSS